MMPEAWLPQMPKAFTSASSESLNSWPAAAAAAKPAVIAVGWKWRACSAPGTASPTRHMTSTAAMSASSTARPLAPAASPAASAVVTATQPVWTMASSRVSSKSRPWASVALASTALAALARARRPSSALSGAPPSRSATSSTARPKSSGAAASALPSVSSASSVACVVTAGGTASRESPLTKRASRRAAVSLAIPLEHLLELGRVHLDLHAGALLLQQHGHPRVALAPAAVERLRHLLQRQVGQAHRHLVLAAERAGQRDILVGQAQRERRRVELAGQEIVGQAVEGAHAPARALADGLEDGQRIDAGLDPHREDLGHRRLDHVAGAVVDELGHGAGADRPDIIGLVADGVEHGLELLEDGLVAADPQRQPSALGAARPAADRRVQHVDAARLEDRVDLAHDGRRVRGEIEERLAGGGAGQQPLLFVERDRLHLDRPRQRGGHDVGRLGHRAPRGDEARTGLYLRLG